MRCTRCGRMVPEGALRCPHCGTDLDVTQRITLDRTSWCPACGALVADGMRCCPKCGTELPGAHARRVRDMDLPDIGATGVMGREDLARHEVRIESAIPSQSDDASPVALRDRMPRTRVFVITALFALLVVGGTALLITHPWDPEASRISATTPADTSKQGFPGAVDSLAGQDGRPQQEAPDASETLAQQLSAVHAQLGELSGRADDLESRLGSTGASGTADERSAARDEATQLALDTSNAIATLQGLRQGSGDVAPSIDSLLTLGNWLRNRVDALSRAWDLSASSQDPAADAARVSAAADAGDEYARLFAEKYDSWAPPA